MTKQPPYNRRQCVTSAKKKDDVSETTTVPRREDIDERADFSD